MTRWRRLHALLAAAFALLAAVLVLNDQSIPSYQLVAADLALIATAAVVLGLAPTPGDWSGARRLLAVVCGVAWFLISVPILVNLIAVAGCACSPGGPDHTPFALLGISARYWGVLAAAEAPAVLLLAAALPHRVATERDARPPDDLD